jgi:hypothetical protein
MRNQTILGLVDVLDELVAGYRDCAERIYAAEQVLTQHKMYGEYVRTRNSVKAGESGFGVESERWNESASHVEKVLAELRKKLTRNPNAKN